MITLDDSCKGVKLLLFFGLIFEKGNFDSIIFFFTNAGRVGIKVILDDKELPMVGEQEFEVCYFEKPFVLMELIFVFCFSSPTANNKIQFFQLFKMTLNCFQNSFRCVS